MRGESPCGRLRRCFATFPSKRVRFCGACAAISPHTETRRYGEDVQNSLLRFSGILSRIKSHHKASRVVGRDVLGAPRLEFNSDGRQSAPATAPPAPLASPWMRSLEGTFLNAKNAKRVSGRPVRRTESARPRRVQAVSRLCGLFSFWNPCHFSFSAPL